MTDDRPTAVPLSELVAIPPMPPSLSGVEVRPGVGADADAVFEVLAAEDTAVLGRVLATRAEVRGMLDSDTSRQARVNAVVERDGRVVAGAGLERIHPDHLYADVFLSPDLDEPFADELSTWGAQWADAAAATLLADGGLGSVQVTGFAWEQNDLRAGRLTAYGYERSRAFLRMTRDLGPDEVYPAPAPGVVIRAAEIDVQDPTSSEAVLVHELISASFADHYNYTASPFDRWWQRRVDEAGFDPSLWFVAELDGVPVGAMLLTRELEEDEQAGYVHYLGTLREGRGRGVARSLLWHCFAVNRDDGLVATKLFVDAESPTGATRLYESVGMTREVVGLEFTRWVRRP